jgi:nitrogen fixation NifU-like protein
MGPDELDELYRDEVILDHRRTPRNPDALDDADITADGVNPFCGDEIHLQINVDDRGRVSQVGFQGAGCSINQATGSMVSEAIEGMTLDEVGAVSEAFRQMVRRDAEPSRNQLSELGDLAALVGVRAFPVRIKCALLAWATLEDGIVDYRRREG